MMETLHFATRAFPWEPEGDLDLCNGQPGSALARWLADALAAQGIPTEPLIQEDYGWGFWLDSERRVWVAISFAGVPESPAELPEWYLSVSAEKPFTLAFWRWFRRDPEAHELAEKVFKLLATQIENHPEVKLLDTQK